MTNTNRKLNSKKVAIVSVLAVLLLSSFMIAPKIYASSPVVQIKSSIFTKMFESVLSEEFNTENTTATEFEIVKKEYIDSFNLLSSNHEYFLHVYDESRGETHIIKVSRKIFQDYLNETNIKMYPSHSQMLHVNEETNTHTLSRIVEE